MTSVPTVASRGRRGRLRSIAWLWGRRLDDRLLRGDAPSASPVLAARAEQLLSRRCRDETAAAVDRLLARAPRLSGRDAARPLRRETILHERATLERIAERLRDRDPVAVRGVVMVRRLLANGAGPVRLAADRRSIRCDPWRALASLEV